MAKENTEKKKSIPAATLATKIALEGITKEELNAAVKVLTEVARKCDVKTGDPLAKVEAIVKQSAAVGIVFTEEQIDAMEKTALEAFENPTEYPTEWLSGIKYLGGQAETQIKVLGALTLK